MVAVAVNTSETTSALTCAPESKESSALACVPESIANATRVEVMIFFMRSVSTV
jgi:hypothetical protein